MGAFGSIIAGAGNAAHDYGAQIRGILEQRRGHLVDLLIKTAGQEGEPEGQAKILKTAHLIASGGDMVKPMQDLMQFSQKRAESNNLLAQAAGGPPKQPTPVPSPTQPGETPGTSMAIPMFGESSPGPAAQPATSPVQAGGAPVQAQPEAPAPTAPSIQPVQPAQAAQPIQPVAQTPAASAPSSGLLLTPAEQSVMDRYQRWNAAGRTPPPDLQEAVKPIFQRMAENQLQQEQIDRRFRNMSDPRTAQLTEELKKRGYSPLQIPAVIASMIGAPANIPGLAQLATPMQRTTTVGDFLADHPEYRDQLAGHDAKEPLRIDVNKLDTSQVMGVYPQPMRNVLQPGEGGTIAPVNPFTGQAGPAITGLQQSSWGIPRNAGVQGNNILFQSPAEMYRGLPGRLGGLSPAMAATQRTTDTQALPTGETISQVTSKKTFPGTTAPSGGAAPKSRPQGTPDWENRVKTIANTVMTGTQSEAQQKATLSILVGPPKSPLAEAVREEMARLQAEDPGPFTFDGPTAQLAQRATQTLTHIDTINKIIARLEAKGELGPIMGRWNEVMTKKLGKDLTANQDYVSLANNMDLLTKNMGWIHGGSRGGGSIQMVQSFGKNINTDKMDADTLRSAINAEKDWIQTYADPKHTTQRSTIPPVQSNIDRLVDKYK